MCGRNAGKLVKFDKGLLEKKIVFLDIGVNGMFKDAIVMQKEL